MAKNAHCHPAQAGLQAVPDGVPADWLVPDWPAPAHVHALFTTRAVGVSLGGYASMNLGDHVGDDPQAVAINRALLAAALQRITPGTRPVFLNQVHGRHCAQLSALTLDGTACDAALATEPGKACTIMVADCLPVLLTDTVGIMVAAAHAGWRGLAAGVLEGVIERFWALTHAHKPKAATTSIASEEAQAASDASAAAKAYLPDDQSIRLMAWLGPCIGPGAFEVGRDVRDAFCAGDAGAASLFEAQGAGKYLANLPGLARRRLAALGVSQVYGNDGSDAWCTVLQASRFFSHRRDGSSIRSADGLRVAGTGRMAACIWLS